MRLTTIALLFVAATPAMAESVSFPVSIPQECYEVAQREHVPVVITNRLQATRAKYKLDRLSDRDPSVSQCRAAVGRAQEAMAR